MSWRRPRVEDECAIDAGNFFRQAIRGVGDRHGMYPRNLPRRIRRASCGGAGAPVPGASGTTSEPHDGIAVEIADRFGDAADFPPHAERTRR